MTDIKLIENSFADVILEITGATDLKPSLKSHWICSLTQIAKWLGRPADSVAARLMAIRIQMDQLHHARLGVTAKTLANHRSNIKRALAWFHQETGAPSRGITLSLAWARLKAAMPDDGNRKRVYPMMRYCSAKGIEPAAVDDTVLFDFTAYRGQTSRVKATVAAQRSVARSWNVCVGTVVGWPKNMLTEPALKAADRLPWEAVPASLCQQIDGYLATFDVMRRGRTGKRIRPNKASSKHTRRAELVAFVRMAVKIGTPVDSLTDLSKLLDPTMVEAVIEAYWAEDEDPPVYVIDLGWKLFRMASNTRAVDAGALQRLDDIRANLEEYRRTGLTPKNKVLVRQVVTEGVWREVVTLPTLLMQQAHAILDHAPVKAAVIAEIAVAIAILTFAPIRLKNLASIELDRHLTKLGVRNGRYQLHFEAKEVKNKVDLDFPLDEGLTALIDDYVYNFRSVLLRGSNGPYLFPGEDGGHKTKTTLSDQIRDRVHKAVGLTITVHQFRHAAAAIYLKAHPGDYETVRRFLGHKNIQTTINFYCGLETTQASEEFGKIVRREMALQHAEEDDE